MKNSSSGALPRGEKNRREEEWKTVRQGLCPGGGQKNRMKNIFEKEDTEEHFDWGSAPGGGTEGKKSETQLVKGGEKQKGRKMENNSSGALPRGGEKQKGRKVKHSSSRGGEKQKGRKMENSSSGALPRGGEKQKGRRVEKQFVRGCARGEEE